MKKGALHKELGISEKNKIPMTLLNKIIAVEIGQTISNTTKTGKKRIKVTRLLKSRAVLARNLKRIRR